MELWNAGNRGSTVMTGTSHPSQAALVPSWLQKGNIGPEAAGVDRNKVSQGSGYGRLSGNFLSDCLQKADLAQDSRGCC